MKKTAEVYAQVTPQSIKNVTQTTAHQVKGYLIAVIYMFANILQRMSAFNIIYFVYIFL